MIRFDDKNGPSCIYSEGVDKNFVEKISMKSHLSTLSLTSNISARDEFIESVIPFLDEGYVAYSTFFFIDDNTARGGKRTLGIVTLVDKSEQMKLYRKIPDISQSIKKIASDLHQKGDPKNQLSIEIKNNLNQLMNLESLSDNIDEINTSVNLIKKSIEEKQENFPLKEESNLITSYHSKILNFPLDRIPQSFDKIIHALLKNDCILVIGSKDEIHLTILALQDFLPHKETCSDLWSIPMDNAEALFSKSSNKINLHVLGLVSDSFDDILNNSNFQKLLSQFDQSSSRENNNTVHTYIGGKVIIDYRKNSVYGGLSNVFCQKLVNTIIDLTDEKAREIINFQINYLLDRVNELTTIFLELNPQKEEIESFIKVASEGEISLLLSIIDELYPTLLGTIIDNFSKYQLSMELLF